MKQKDSVEMERYALLTRIRAEAHIVRAKWLNEVLPAVMQEYDRRLTGGESTVVEIPTADALIEEALKQIDAS